MSKADSVNSIIRTLRIIINDLRKACPSDEQLIKVEFDFKVIIEVDPFKVATVVGKLLDRYCDEIIKLTETNDFTEFINKRFNDEISEVKSSNRELVEYLIERVKKYVLTLNKKDVAKYAEYVSSMLDNYYNLE